MSPAEFSVSVIVCCCDWWTMLCRVNQLQSDCIPCDKNISSEECADNGAAGKGVFLARSLVYFDKVESYASAKIQEYSTLLNITCVCL